MNNVVQLFSQKKKIEAEQEIDDDVTGLILSITNWSEARGVDVYNDVGFQIRVADLMAQLKLLAKNNRKAATA